MLVLFTVVNISNEPQYDFIYVRVVHTCKNGLLLFDSIGAISGIIFLSFVLRKESFVGMLSLPCYSLY